MLKNELILKGIVVLVRFFNFSRHRVWEEEETVIRDGIIIQPKFIEGTPEMETRSKKTFVATLIAISIMILLAAQSAVAKEAQATPIRKISIAALETRFAVSPDHPEVDPKYVERRVREYFADIPVMIGLCGCESEFRQYREDGTLLVSRWINPKTGKRGSSASGVCQITYKNHYDNWSKSPKTDITTLEGNLAYARWLYQQNGTSDWSECGG